MATVILVTILSRYKIEISSLLAARLASLAVCPLGNTMLSMSLNVHILLFLICKDTKLNKI